MVAPYLEPDRAAVFLVVEYLVYAGALVLEHGAEEVETGLFGQRAGQHVATQRLQHYVALHTSITVHRLITGAVYLSVADQPAELIAHVDDGEVDDLSVADEEGRVRELGGALHHVVQESVLSKQYSHGNKDKLRRSNS